MPPKAGPELYSRSGNSTESKPPSTPSKKDKGKEKETNDHSASATKPNATTTELRIECRRKNAPGVRLIAREPEKNGQIMAAYLCFETVTELKEFIASEEVETIIAELNSGYAVNFNIVGVKTKCNIINKTFHSTLASMKDSEWQVINSDQSIPLNFKATGLRANNIRIAYLNSICAALRLIHAAGDYISADDPEVAGKVRGYTPENWNRALCLSKFCIRESGASRTKEAGKKGRATAAAKDAPVEIEFLTDEDFATMRDAPADGEVSQADQYNFFAARQALEEAFVDNNDDNVDDLTQCTAEDLKGVDEHATELSKVFTTRLPASVNASVSRKVRSQRPIITKQETLAFCQGLKSRVRINCSADDIDKTRSLDATTSSRNMRIISLGQQEAAAERAAEDGDEAELDDDVKERMHQAALAIKATMTQNSAPHPAYLEACEWVGVDPNTRRFYGSLDHEGDETLPVIELKFWQPMTAYFMHKQEQTVYRWGIIALDCGLGKTLSTLVHIITSTQHKFNYNALNPDDKKIFRATLVVCPAGAIEIWHADIEKFFPKGPLKIYQFFGTPKTVPNHRLSNLIQGGVDELNTFLNDLDPSDPQTSNTIIITAYTTWWNRTLATIEGDQVVQYYGSVAAASDDAEMAPAGRYWSSICTYKFERIVGDEAHTLRNPRTLISEGMKQTQTLSKTWLTATPILNHPKDLRGMLAQMWTPNWALHNVGLGFLECYQEAFNPRAFEHTVAGETRLVSFLPPNTEEHKEKYHAYQAALQNNDKIWLLDPDNYKICGSREDWSPYATNLIIPPILKMVMLRMTAASHIDLGDGKPPRRVGEDVPPCSIYAIELQMDRDEARLYNDATHHLYKHLFIGDTDMIEGLQCTTQPSVQGKNSDSPEGIQDAGVHRFIMHSTLDPRLASLTLRNHKDMTKEQKRAAAKTKRNNWVDVDFDHGASFYYAKTRHGREYAIPADRLSLATYMCAKSVKIREILYLLSEWVLKLQEKVILVFEFPMSQWDVETQLINLGFKVVSLRSTQTQDERAKHLHDFNHDPDVQILLFNTKLGSQSLNLHVGGHRIIACEMPVNMSTFLQVVGRISRVGQRFPCTVYLLWVTDSYDQILLHKLCKKFVATFAGEGGVVTDDSDITENAEEVFRDFFGLKYSPYNIAWGDPNFRHKYDWIRKFEKAKAAEQEVREVESEDDEDEFHTPQLSRRQRPSLPSTTGKIGQSRYCNPGEYSVNVMQKKAINGAVTEGDKETPELSNTVESSPASELPASPTRGPAKPPNPPKNPKNPKPRAGPAKPHVPQAEPNKKADAPKIGPKANKPSAGGRGKKRASTAGDDTQEPQPKRQRQQRSAAKVAQQKLSEEKVTETDGDEAADNE